MTVDSMETREKQRADQFSCPGCGAGLVFDPQNQDLSCPYCGRREALHALPGEIAELSFEQFARPRPEIFKPLAENALQVSCNTCGAIVEFMPPEVAGQCPFCASHLVAQPKIADPMLAPQALLPFQITQKQAHEAIKEWVSSLWFAPNALKKMAYYESVGGMYLPFWTYDAETRSHYTGQRGEYYYVTESYTETDSQGRQVTKTRNVRKTRWYPASGSVQRAFDDVLVPATTSVSRQRLLNLEPWSLPLLKTYQPAYLAGYKAQRYALQLPEGFEQAKQIMYSVIEGDVRADIGGDEQMVEHINTSYSEVTFKHILLPVYLGAYRFNQKVFQVMVNAQTGEVQGDRPYSAWKITLFVLLIIIVVSIFIYLAK